MSQSPITEEFLTNLRAVLPSDVFGDLPENYLEEPRKRFSGFGGELLKPRTVDEVSSIIKVCAKFNVGIVPYGGGTGLVGGQVKPDAPEVVILSLERLNKLRGAHPEENLLTVEAGMILGNVQSEAEKIGKLFPLSLASEGSCQIGGNLATNAGGVQVVRYGSARDLCIGLEAVLPDGSIWNSLSRLRKDNTGFDLKSLLIGSEGTLGVITAATLKLFPRPVEQTAALVVVKNPAAAVRLFAKAQEQLTGMVSAFELIAGQGLEFLSETMPEVRLPFEDIPPWTVLIDLGAEAGAGAQGRLERFLASELDKEDVTDALVSQSLGQRREFWTLRETIPEANRIIGSIYSHDIALPIGCIPEFIELGKLIADKYSGLRVNCFGHLGDGNLHYNFFPPKGGNRKDYDAIREELSRATYDLVNEFGGSISAEHGIGRLKLAELNRYASPAKIAAMGAIKSALDPTGIMNPGAVIRRKK